METLVGNEVDKLLSAYAGYMEEIKKRESACGIVLAQLALGRAATGYKETDIDFLYLQIRKILELVMFASTVAHKIDGRKWSREAENAYHAGKLIKLIEATNPRFFPSPKEDRAIEGGRRSVDDKAQTLTEPYLTKEEFVQLYARACGSFVHAGRRYQYGNEAAKDRHITECALSLGKIRRLLNHHWVHLTDELAVAVIMQSSSDNKVHVSILQKLSGSTPHL